MTARTLNAQILVSLAAPPPYQFKMENLWRVTLVNPTSTTYRVYLIGRATERNDGRIVDVTTTTFTLAPGMKVIQARDLAPLSVKESNSKYSDVVKKMGAVPSGEYDICVSVYNATNDALLGEMCVQSQVQNLSQVDLLEPHDGAVFSLRNPEPPRYRQQYDLKSMLKDIPKGYDARTALWALLNVLYPASKIKTEGDDPEGPDWPPSVIVKDTHDIGAQGRTSLSKIKTEGDDIEWLPGIIVHDTNDCSGQGIQYFQMIKGLKDPEGFLRTLGIVEDPATLLDILVGHLRSNASVSKPEQKEHSGIAQSLPGGIMTLSWVPPTPVPPGARVSYTLRITKSIGRQSPYDAIHSNPATILLKDLPANMVQLPLAARQVEPGTYAWSVQVFLNGALMQESEVHWFTVYEHKKPKPTDDYGTSLPRIHASLFPSATPIERAQYGASSMFVPGAPFRNVPRSRPFRSAKLYSSLSTEREFFLSPFVPPLPVAPKSASVAPFALVGSARFNGEFADRSGTFSEMPRNYLTADLQPGVVLYGLPFGGNFQYSTLQDDSRQNINSFSLNFDFESMRQGLESRLQDAVADAKSSVPAADQFNAVERRSQELTAGAQALSSLSADQLENIATPSMLAENLDHFGSISGAEKLFMNIRSLGMGTNYPSYSEYILSGVPVTGFNVELNPGVLYTAFTASQNQRPIDNMSYRRDLYAGRLGLGKKDATHLIFSGMYVSDDATSIHPDTSNTTLAPRENYVFGMETKISMFDEHLALEGEGAMSLFTRDTRDAPFASSSIPSVVKNLTNPRLSSSVDYMYTGRVAYTNNASSTRMSAAVKMVGPGYSSLGVPNLRSDNFGYEGKFDQQLWKNRISFGAFYRTYRDNLIAWKSSTSTMTVWGASLGLNVPSLPYVRVSYSPVTQSSNAAESLHIGSTNMAMTSAMTGYSYAIGQLSASTSLSYTRQSTETGDTAGRYASTSYMLGQTVNFAGGISVGMNVGLTEAETIAGISTMQSVDLSGSVPLGEVLSAGIGATAAFDRDRDERIGIYASATARLASWMDLDMRVEHTNYNDFLFATSTYQELRGSAALSVRW